MLFLASLAMAADLSRYPVCASVELPPTGPVRIAVPLELRSQADPADGSDLLLLDQHGRHVPAFRLVEGKDQLVDPGLVPTKDPFRFLLDLGELPIEELLVSMPAGLPPASATVRQRGRALAPPTLVWRLEDTANDRVPIEPATGWVELVLVPTQGRSLGGGPSVLAVRRRMHVPFSELELPVGEAVQQDDGWSRYDIALPRVMPVSSLEVHAHDPVFSRYASVQTIPWAPPGQALQPPTPTDQQRITRVKVADLSVASTRVISRQPPSDRLALLIEDRGLPPLQIERVTVRIPGAELVAQDVGAGPHRLCGGAPPKTTPVPAFGEAAAEIARAAKQVSVPGPAEPNPLWQSPEQRAQLAVPGRALTVSDFRWRRPIEGEGLVRIVLPQDLVTVLRPDLGDLRVVSQGRQVPHLLRALPSHPVLEGVEVERKERGQDSLLRVKLPQAGLQVQRLVLWTSAPVFSRRLTVGLPTSRGLEPRRHVEWVGTDSPSVLALSLGRWGGQQVDRELQVVIHNEDDAPLPIERVEVQVTGWELLTVVPEQGAELVYGAPRVSPASYDLELLASELHQRATTLATLGPASPIHKPPLGSFDRALLGAGMAVLSLGLAALLFDLVRRLPPVEEPSKTPAETSEVS